MVISSIVESLIARYAISCLAVVIAAGVLSAVSGRVNTTTVALALLLIVLTTATFFGRNPALLASFVAMLSFNYLFLPPVGTWHISDPRNLIAWAAFTITAIIAGELSEYARRRSRESERLYIDLQSAFTDKAEAEAVRQSEKLKSALLDAVTHDLRTPLTSIKAAVTTLLESEGGHRTIELDSSGRGEFLAIINEETDRLNKFIEDMVRIAKVEAAAVRTVDSVSRIDDMVKDALFRASSIAAGRRVVINVRDGLPAVRADARSMSEVIYSLVENAVKYSPPGSPIHIDSADEGENIAVTVTDEGPGIELGMRNRAFEKFVRLDPNASTGLGLGLSIARGIVEAQGGTIELTGGSGGVGTSAVVRLRPVRE